MFIPTNTSICSEREWSLRPPALMQNDNNQDWRLDEGHLTSKNNQIWKKCFYAYTHCSKHEPNSQSKALRELSSNLFSSSKNQFFNFMLFFRCLFLKQLTDFKIKYKLNFKPMLRFITYSMQNCFIVELCPHSLVVKLFC